uniref:Lysosome-associated membrane glycoprotein 3 n=1 Tax=Otolemur garnettii TaxID=30611 RepID=H0WGX6_OTOGA
IIAIIHASSALFNQLSVITSDGCQTGAKAFSETRVHLQPTVAKPSLLQPTGQVTHGTPIARSKDGHNTSRMAATVKTPTTSQVTTKNAPSTSPNVHTLITTQAIANNSHTAAPVSADTLGTISASHSQPPSITPPVRTTGTNPSAVSCTTGQTTTLSTASHKSTTSQKPIQSTHAPETPTRAHNATQTASPAPTAPGPTLAPKPSAARIGTYQVLNGSKLCIKAEMGIQLIVRDKQSVLSPQRYFNIEPNATHTSGNCGFQKSNLLLNFQGGFVNLTFTKDEKSYYINEVGASLTVSNPEIIYRGLKSGMVMFETVLGHSFRCVSEQSLQLSAQFQLQTMNVQLQAFDFEDDRFGNVDECSSDYTIALPVIGGVVVGLILLGMGVNKIRLKCQSSGYQRI